jgi:hypothetical protein
MRVHHLRGIFLPLLFGLASVACGRTLQTPAPLQQGDGGVDSGRAAPDAAPSEAQDASGGADVESDATSVQSDDAETDAPTFVDKDAGGADAADAIDAADASDAPDAADASIQISCDESATCAAPIQLPFIYGGVSGGGNNTHTTTSGDHSDWYTIEVEPDPPPAALLDKITATVWLYPPPGMEFDLDVYVTTPPDSPPSTCSQVSGSSTGTPGAMQSVSVSWPTGTGFQILGWVTIHVIAKAGSQCATGETWTLEVWGS